MEYSTSIQVLECCIVGLKEDNRKAWARIEISGKYLDIQIGCNKIPRFFIKNLPEDDFSFLIELLQEAQATVKRLSVMSGTVLSQQEIVKVTNEKK